MLEKIDIFIKRFLPFFTVMSLVCGILIGGELQSFTFLIPWIFAFLTFSGSLGMNFKQLLDVLHHPLPLFTSIIILHAVMPLWAGLISRLFFAGDSLTITGFLLAMVVPTGVTSFMWIAIYKGNLSLGLSIILVDTLLAPFIVTGSLWLFVGKIVHIDLVDLIVDLFIMIVLPSLLAMGLNQLTKGKVSGKLNLRLSPLSKLGLFVIVFINGGVISGHIREIGWKVLIIILVVLIISISGFIISFLIARGLKMAKESQITVMYTGGMRNIVTGSVLAITYFPSQVAIPVIMGMLFQQVMASFFGSLFQYLNRESLKGSLFRTGRYKVLK